MPSLTLKRKRFAFGALRSLQLQVDEQTVVPLGFGGEKTIDLPAGTYHLVARMDWCSSEPLPIALTEGDRKFVSVDSSLPQALLMVFLPPFTAFTMQEKAGRALS